MRGDELRTIPDLLDRYDGMLPLSEHFKLAGVSLSPSGRRGRTAR